MSKKAAASVARRSAAGRLELERQALAETQGEISKLEAELVPLLLADDDGAAVRINRRIDELRGLQRASEQKIELLQVAAKREAEEAAENRRQAVLERTAARLAKADELTDVAQARLAELIDLTHQIGALRQECRAVFLGGNAHENSAINNPDGAGLSGASFVVWMSNEIFRLNPPLDGGGTPGVVNAPRFPGGTCPKIELMLTPGRIEPLSTRARKASAFALELLKKRDRALPFGDVDPPPAPPSPTAGPAAPANGAVSYHTMVAAHTPPQPPRPAPGEWLSFSNGKASSRRIRQRRAKRPTWPWSLRLLN